MVLIDREVCGVERRIDLVAGSEDETLNAPALGRSVGKVEGAAQVVLEESLVVIVAAPKHHRAEVDDGIDVFDGRVRGRLGAQIADQTLNSGSFSLRKTRIVGHDQPSHAIAARDERRGDIATGASGDACDDNVHVSLLP